MNIDRPYCLSIAGYDPTAGAGVLADIKTFEMFGVYGMAIISSNTFQTDDQFTDIHWINVGILKIQMQMLMNKYDFKVLKIGLIQNFDTLYQVITLAKKLKPAIHVIWDPILKSSSGYNFHSGNSIELSFLEENCFLITPNWDEFETLWGTHPEVLTERKFNTSILIKGGHRKDQAGSDLLYSNDQFFDIEGSPFNGKSKHGTGCVLSAAITACLAKGKSLIDSCYLAKSYVEQFILSNDSNLGYHYENN
ncbi:MAG TPA: hydroxymethylpyrimidine/phosphomethylpyrimidine kinase [Paludibacter sp.]